MSVDKQSLINVRTDRQTIMYAGSVTGRMLVAQRAVRFIRFIAGKGAFCMCVRIPFYISLDVLFAVHSIASWSRTHTRTKLDVRGSVHHSKIHKEKSNKMQQYIKIFSSVMEPNTQNWKYTELVYKETRISLYFQHVVATWEVHC